MYGELSAARIPAEFALAHHRLQREWAFQGSFLLALAAVNAGMFAINPDAIFKVNSYAYTAISTSSAACALGIACDVWFLLRYNWVDLGIFVCRSRDLYGSYVFFSLSSRMPTFCALISSMSLMASLGIIAYDGGSKCVVVIGVVVVLIMTLQFIVYAVDQFIASALHAWRAVAALMVKLFKV